MVGLLLGFRELLCLFGRILCSTAGGVTSFFSHTSRGCFQGGSTHHVDVTSRPRSYRVSTRHVVAVYRYRGSTRHVVAVYQGTKPSLWISVGKFLPSPIQSVPIPSERFFFLTDSPYSSPAHFDTPLSGPFGRNGSHGEST